MAYEYPILIHALIKFRFPMNCLVKISNLDKVLRFFFVGTIEQGKSTTFFHFDETFQTQNLFRFWDKWDTTLLQLRYIPFFSNHRICETYKKCVIYQPPILVRLDTNLLILSQKALFLFFFFFSFATYSTPQTSDNDAIKKSKPKTLLSLENETKLLIIIE